MGTTIDNNSLTEALASQYLLKFNLQLFRQDFQTAIADKTQFLTNSVHNLKSTVSELTGYKSNYLDLKKDTERILSEANQSLLLIGEDLKIHLHSKRAALLLETNDLGGRLLTEFFFQEEKLWI